MTRIEKQGSQQRGEDGEYRILRPCSGQVSNKECRSEKWIPAFAGMTITNRFLGSARNDPAPNYGKGLFCAGQAGGIMIQKRSENWRTGAGAGAVILLIFALIVLVIVRSIWFATFSTNSAFVINKPPAQRIIY